MVSFSETLRLTIMINVPQTIILDLRLKTALLMRSFK